MCCTVLDLVKAIDTVNHSVLLKKLPSYGSREIAFQLIKGFLDDRKQYTVVKNVCTILMSFMVDSWEALSTSSSVVKNVCSLSYNVTCGVPEGSTLGRLLFLININDLVQTTNFKVNLFADDTVLVMSNKSKEKLQNQVNYEMKMERWMNANKGRKTMEC